MPMREGSASDSSSSATDGSGKCRKPHEACGSCSSSSSIGIGKKCGHAVKKQRAAKFYIVRRCIAMLVCWRDRSQ